MERKEISKSVLKRLPGYLSYLKSIPEGELVYISATALANALSMGEVQVRKDLAMVSDGGRPKIGYLRSQLIEDISQFLSTSHRFSPQGCAFFITRMSFNRISIVISP